MPTNWWLIAVAAAFGAGFATCAAMVAVITLIRRERDKALRDERIVLVEVARRDGATISELSGFARLSPTQTAYALERLMKAGMVRSQGGHVSLEVTRFYALPEARFRLAAMGVKL